MDYVEGIISQRSIGKRQVHFCQNFKEQLEQRTLRNIRILPRGVLSQERTQGSKGVYRGISDNFFAHQEKRWPEITSCLDWKEAVQVIQQGGLSSAGDNEYGDNFQAGQ